MGRRVSGPIGVLAAVLLVLAGSAAAALSAGGPGQGEIGPAFHTTSNGRHLVPAGRLTQVGDFPTGGALTRDGRFYWAVDSGHGKDDVRVVNVATGAVVQTLPLPGAYGGITFSPDGSTAYAAGEPRGSSVPEGPTLADGGDAIHMFAVDQATGRGAEQAPIALPPTATGAAKGEGATLDWPIGLSVTPDGGQLLVALQQADALAIIDLTSPTHATRLVTVGKFPNDVVADPHGGVAYVSNELDGTVSVVDLSAGSVVASVGVGGSRGDLEAHPEGMVADPNHPRLYVAVTSRDAVAVIDTSTRTLLKSVSVARDDTLGTAPVNLAESPDGATLYAADSGEDAVAAIALTDRPTPGTRHADIHQYDLIGRLPTAAYPSAVAVTPDGKKLVWLAANGYGAGPNPGYGTPFANSNAAPYGTYVPDMMLGYVGVLNRPTDVQMAQQSHRADRQIMPTDTQPAPANTPVVGPNGGPSQQIKHVFYVVRENRTYDQIFGSDPRGDGDRALEVADDNGVPGPAGGITPNAHALARRFPLLDHFYADSEVSTDGHQITSSSYAIDFVKKSLHADYSGRGHVNNPGVFPETYPPNDYVFDQAVRQSVSFKDFGEFQIGVVNDGRPTYNSVLPNVEITYPFHFGCDGSVPNLACSTDSGHPTGTPDPTISRFDYFKQQFDQWVAGGADNAPSFVYVTLPNDHTNGASPGHPTPASMFADNDLGLGQLVDLISHSPIWKDSAIFVQEDDSQDGADHVDAHRMPAFVISPYARAGAVVPTRYDQYSMLRTVELMLGLKPLSLNDSLAVPMYDAFTTHPDFRPYDAITPTHSLTDTNPSASAAPASLTQANSSSSATAASEQAFARSLPFDQTDLVPQALSDEVIWHTIYGWNSTPPPPGPGASPAEDLRAKVAERAYAQHTNVTQVLKNLAGEGGNGGDGDG